MKPERAAGVLLHPTSLPSPFGIGDLGPMAYQFVDFLVAAGQKLWQILPLNPSGYGGSPYQSFSAFAGNTLLISPERLAEQGLLSLRTLEGLPGMPQEQVCFALAERVKANLFAQAFTAFQRQRPSEAYGCFLEEHRYWLGDYTLFMALKEYFNGLPWTQWEHRIAHREEGALRFYGEKLAERRDYHCFLQYQFHKQWLALKSYAQSQGLTIIGDLPLFISADSSDTWVYPELFWLDERGHPEFVAGVPPDYFSPTGQRWGNPHYRWEIMAQDDYRWWRERVRILAQWVDFIRLDHFRGLEAYWEIAVQEETAVVGRWVKGPGPHFLSTLERHLGHLPLIAEDLGFITPEVRALKNDFHLPGMRILQFEEKTNCQRRQEEVIFYTGTHDNDTVISWYRDKVLKELSQVPEGLNLKAVCWEFIEVVFQSPASWAIIPLQDILCLDGWARMNTPGTSVGNWSWRYLPGSLNAQTEKKLWQLTDHTGRV